MANLICGVDVSARTLDARIGRDGAYQRFDNDPDGIAALAAFCQEHGADLVVMEATGGYEKQPFALLWAKQVPGAIVNPRSVRRFAQAMGLLEKTDRIDSGVIAWYGEIKRIVAQQPASQAQQELEAAATLLRQLVDEQTCLSNQGRLVTDSFASRLRTKVLAAFAHAIRACEQRIIELIDTDPLWRELDAEFRTIKGVAHRTSARMLAELPEIGTISNKAIGKLAGLAPLADDSGQHKGIRRIRGGRANVRSILYMSAGVAAKHEPDFTAFRDRMTAAGKPKMVTRTALAHKLLTRLNAKARQVRQRLTAAAAGAAGAPAAA